MSLQSVDFKDRRGTPAERNDLDKERAHMLGITLIICLTIAGTILGMTAIICFS